MMSRPQKSIVRIGTRRSQLAMAQTKWVISQLSRFAPDIRAEVIEVVTTGDRLLNQSASKIPGKGIFVKEIEEKLLTGEIDFAVHSMKDLPTEFRDELTIGAVTERVDPRDILVTRHNRSLQALEPGSRIGTGSLRRKTQVLQLRPDLEVIDIRGNIDTRLAKAETDQYDGILLAAAGLQRMGWQARIQEFFSCDVMTPAVGQGALGIEIRKGDNVIRNLLAPLNDPVIERCVMAERLFLQKMGGGCQTPIGAYCQEKSGGITFHAYASNEAGDRFERLIIDGRLSHAAEMALQAARDLTEVAGVLHGV